jgi:hypothetical protein
VFNLLIIKDERGTLSEFRKIIPATDSDLNDRADETGILVNDKFAD